MNNNIPIIPLENGRDARGGGGTRENPRERVTGDDSSGDESGENVSGGGLGRDARLGETGWNFSYGAGGSRGLERDSPSLGDRIGREALEGAIWRQPPRESRDDSPRRLDGTGREAHDGMAAHEPRGVERDYIRWNNGSAPVSRPGVNYRDARGIHFRDGIVEPGGQSTQLITVQQGPIARHAEGRRTSQPPNSPEQNQGTYVSATNGLDHQFRSAMVIDSERAEQQSRAVAEAQMARYMQRRYNGYREWSRNTELDQIHHSAVPTLTPATQNVVRPKAIKPSKGVDFNLRSNRGANGTDQQGAGAGGKEKKINNTEKKEEKQEEELPPTFRWVHIEIV